MQTALWNILFFFVVIAILITIHEFGHFYVARRCGVKVLRFSIGFGPVVWRRIGRDGTEYAISLIPLGGYVKMKGESADEPEADSRDARANGAIAIALALTLAPTLALLRARLQVAPRILIALPRKV